MSVALFPTAIPEFPRPLLTDGAATLQKAASLLGSVPILTVRLLRQWRALHLGSPGGDSDPYHQVDVDVLGDITRCILDMALYSNL